RIVSRKFRKSFCKEKVLREISAFPTCFPAVDVVRWLVVRGCFSGYVEANRNSCGADSSGRGFVAVGINASGGVGGHPRDAAGAVGVLRAGGGDRAPCVQVLDGDMRRVDCVFAMGNNSPAIRRIWRDRVSETLGLAASAICSACGRRFLFVCDRR